MIRLYAKFRVDWTILRRRSLCKLFLYSKNLSKIGVINFKSVTILMNEHPNHTTCA